MKIFSAFFEENYSLIVGVAERRLDSRSDAEEIATEAFRIAWEKYQAGCPLSTPWLYGIVRNLIGDEYRRRRRRADLQHQLNSNYSTSSPIAHELLVDVRDAVERLPSQDREVLRMTYWERLTSEEVATILQISSAAVRARVMRARRQVLAALSDSNTASEGKDDAGKEVHTRE